MYDKVTVRTRMCVPSNSNCENVNFQTVSVTLTFEVGTWVLDATRRLDVVNICAKVFKKPLMRNKVTVRTRTCVPSNSYCENVNFQTVSVTLTFEVGTWVLDATRHLDVVNTCAKLF
jgi:hypothetical protein